MSKSPKPISLIAIPSYNPINSTTPNLPSQPHILPSHHSDNMQIQPYGTHQHDICLTNHVSSSAKTIPDPKSHLPLTLHFQSTWFAAILTLYIVWDPHYRMSHYPSKWETIGLNLTRLTQRSHICGKKSTPWYVHQSLVKRRIYHRNPILSPAARSPIKTCLEIGTQRRNICFPKYLFHFILSRYDMYVLPWQICRVALLFCEEERWRFEEVFLVGDNMESSGASLE